jgi:hypothetical protein
MDRKIERVVVHQRENLCDTEIIYSHNKQSTFILKATNQLSVKSFVKNVYVYQPYTMLQIYAC